MFIIFGIATILYGIFMLWVCLGTLLSKNKSGKRLQAISLIIAARNEEENLPYLLDSLVKMDYPHEEFEIIIVNDHSTDKSSSILASEKRLENLIVLENDTLESAYVGKKAALALGIAAARHDILVFTDADCLPHPQWLRSVSDLYDDECDCQLGYTMIKEDPNATIFSIKNFERCIYYALAAAGLYWGKPFTASASNFSYRKSLFERAKGFDGIGHIRSGDDDLLLMKMFPFIRNAVFNFSAPAMMISIEKHGRAQRYESNVRKASKLKYYPLWLMLTALFVFGYFIASYFTLPFINDPFIRNLWIYKSATELAMMSVILLRLKLFKMILFYPLALVWYPIKFVYFGIRGTVGKYRWKELHLD